MKEKSAVSIKLIAFSVIGERLSVFFPENKLPNTELDKGYSLDSAAGRIFKERIKLPLKDSYLEQLYTITQDQNNEKGIIVAYYILVAQMRIEQQSMPFWIPLGQLELHNQDYKITNYAVQRLRWKIEYTNVVYSLLPAEFTLSELQMTYQAILGKKLDKRNFRKKILSLGLVKPSGRTRTGVKARPAQIYQFKQRKPVMVKVFS